MLSKCQDLEKAAIGRERWKRKIEEARRVVDIYNIIRKLFHFTFKRPCQIRLMTGKRINNQ